MKPGNGRFGIYLGLATAAGALAAVVRQRDRIARGLLREPSLIYGGAARLMTGTQAHPVKAHRITIGKPRHEVFLAWRQLRNLSRFVPYLTAVRETDGGNLRFTATLPGGGEVEWDARIVSEREGEYLEWQSLGGIAVTTRGSISFAPAPADRGTEVTLEIEYGGAALGEQLAEVAAEATYESLRRLKQWVETGEIATVTGQPSGRDPETRRSDLRETAARFVSPAYSQRTVDHALEESFPASDPPAFGSGG